MDNLLKFTKNPFMELSPKQQTTELIKKANKILLIGKKNPDGDTIGSLLALSEILNSLDKEVMTVVTEDIAPHYNFLPKVKEIKKELEGTNDLVIKINVKDNLPEKLHWNEKDGVINIIISPSQGNYSEDNISFGKGFYDFDLVIVLDTPDVDMIDETYDKMTDLFFEKPVINIDHHAGNEYFGTVNLVDMTATSTAEILVSIIESLGANLLTEEVATNLLAGIIYDTGSFKNKNTTPKSLTVAAQLLAAGAAQQEIIDNFYKAKAITTLKLWGKILSGLVQEEDLRLVWTKVNHEDFKESGMNIVEVSSVIDELLVNTPGADVVLLLVEEEKNKIYGKLRGQRGTDVLKLAEIFDGKGQFHSADFEINHINYEQIDEKVISKISQNIKKRLGITEGNSEKRIFVPLQKLDKEKLTEKIEKTGETNENQKYEAVKEKKEISHNFEMTKEDEKKVIKEIKTILENDIKSEKKIERTQDISNNDAIDKALESLEKEGLDTISTSDIKVKEDKKSFTVLGDILKNKKIEPKKIDNSVFFDDETEYIESDDEFMSYDEDEGGNEIRVWKE